MVTVVFVALAGPASAATLVADYQFQGSLGNSSGAAPALTEFSWMTGGTGSFGTETVFGVSRQTWSFPEGTGLVMNGANNVIGNQYSIAIVMKLNALGGYQKLIDFRHNADFDAGLYVIDSNLNTYACGHATSTSNPIDSNTYQQIVMTRDSQKKVRVYVNGTQVLSGDDTTDGCTLGTGSQIHFFVDDDYSCEQDATSCEQGAGAVARIRVYNGALTSQEVAALDTVPGAEPPEGTEHARSVSLNLKKHLVANGAVSVPDGFLACKEGVTVSVQRKTSSGFKTIKNAVTSASGTYKTKLPDKKGVYRASLAVVSAGGSDTCGAAVSPTKRHRH